MNENHRRSRRVAFVLATIGAAALVAACGGGGHDDPPATSEVPASASASADGFIDYLRRLVASSADTLEPVDTSMVSAPVDDTREPVTVP